MAAVQEMLVYRLPIAAEQLTGKLGCKLELLACDSAMSAETCAWMLCHGSHNPAEVHNAGHICGLDALAV